MSTSESTISVTFFSIASRFLKHSDASHQNEKTALSAVSAAAQGFS
ncbi:hypothetical protein [Acinetobacter indicus]|nr:hypothetical protein [Acinetobacter indicus]UNW04723.1 hypothetical protein MOW12_02385 [Acinetobacter indicus]